MTDEKRHSPITVRPAVAADRDAWLALWTGYCDFYRTKVPDEVTESTWSRLLDPAWPMGCVVACADGGAVIGMANYVLHPNTWSARTLCYLEDLFVAPEWRGRGAATALIRALEAMGRDRGWLRVYWMTRTDNGTARAVYDRIAPVTDWVRYDLNLPTGEPPE